MTTSNFAIILIVLGAILWIVLDIRRSQKALTDVINAISIHLEDIANNAEHNEEIEQNTIKAINDMCRALNTYFNTGSGFMNDASFSLRNLAACMIPYMNSIKRGAVERQEYEVAQECLDIINNLKQIVNKQ